MTLGLVQLCIASKSFVRPIEKRRINRGERRVREEKAEIKGKKLDSGKCPVACYN